MKRTVKIIAGILVAFVLFIVMWDFAYPRLFPERMKATQATYQDWLQKNTVSK